MHNMKYIIPLRLPRRGAFVKYQTKDKERIAQIYGELYPYNGEWWDGEYIEDDIPYIFKSTPLWTKDMNEIYWEFDIPYEEYYIK